MAQLRLDYRTNLQNWVGLAQSVERLSCLMLWGIGMLDPRLGPHQYLYARMWMKQFDCHAGCQEVSRCCTTDESLESIVHKWQSTQVRESTLALRPRGRATRSPKQEYQWPNKKRTCVLQKLNNRKKKLHLQNCVFIYGNNQWSIPWGKQVNKFQYYVKNWHIYQLHQLISMWNDDTYAPERTRETISVTSFASRTLDKHCNR